MKKQYFVLSILIAVVITFGVLSGVFFDRYVHITKEIVGKDTGYIFTSVFPTITMDENGVPTIEQKQRPDTSALKADANVALTLGIVFVSIASIALVFLVLWIIKIIKNKKSQQQQENN